MTAIVGILCKDGVVIGTDSSATFGQGQAHTIEQPTDKIHIIKDKIIVTATGEVGLLQRHKQIIEDMWEKKEFSKEFILPNNQNNSRLNIGKSISTKTINDFSSTHLKQFQLASLVAFPFDYKAHLCEFGIGTIQPEFKDERLWYCSLGSSQHITDTFLAFIRDVFWQNERPTLVEGIFATSWVLDHTISINTGGVNGPVKIAILNNVKGEIKAEMVVEHVLSEQKQNIDEVKSELRKWSKKFKPINALDIPKLT